jgi:hypothetical protein
MTGMWNKNNLHTRHSQSSISHVSFQCFVFRHVSHEELVAQKLTHKKPELDGKLHLKNTLANLSGCVVCGRSLAGIAGSNPTGGHGCLYLVIVVCCQVEVSATGRSLAQRSPTK